MFSRNSAACAARVWPSAPPAPAADSLGCLAQTTAPAARRHRAAAPRGRRPMADRTTSRDRGPRKIPGATLPSAWWRDGSVLCLHENDTGSVLVISV